MNSRDNRNVQSMNLRHQLLALPRQSFRFLRRFAVADHVDVCSGDKIVRFRGDKHHAAQLFVFTELLNNGAHLRGKFRLQGIHFLIRYVDGDDSNVVQTNIKSKR